VRRLRCYKPTGSPAPVADNWTTTRAARRPRWGTAILKVRQRILAGVVGTTVVLRSIHQ